MVDPPTSVLLVDVMYRVEGEGSGFQGVLTSRTTVLLPGHPLKFLPPHPV